jgi:hypothetical protein
MDAKDIPFYRLADASRRLTEEIIAAAQEVVRARHDVLAGRSRWREALDRLEALVGRPPE